MSNKHMFLVPVGVAAAALLGSTKPAASNPNAPEPTGSPANEAATSTASDSMTIRVRTSPDRVDSFLLTRSDDTGLIAHASHDSHSSHASHASHSSHYSSVSLA